MRVTIAHILAAAQEVSITTVGEIIGEQRHQYIVRVRQACYYLARLQGYSYPNIGRRMNRDHSSAIHGARKCQDMMARDPGYSALVYRIGARAFELSENQRGIYRQLGAQLEAAA